MEYIKLDNISKSYDKQIIKNVSMDIQKGKITCLIGKSGVGKTTIFNILAGFENVDKGKIYLEGEDITFSKKDISYMMQKPMLIPYFNVLDNVCLSFKIKGIDKKIAYEKAFPIIEKFGLLEHKDKYPDKLSAGMKQRVSFIRAYLKEANFMLLDEPFSALDSFTKENIHRWLKNIIKEEEKTCILITHDITEAIYLADRIYILDGNPANIRLCLDIEDINFEMGDRFLYYYNKINKLIKN